MHRRQFNIHNTHINESSLVLQIIEKLALEPLPGEGGFYRETYRSKQTLDARTLGIPAQGLRSVGTAIYYLVTEQNFSALHRVKGDEIFHFYCGDPVEMIQFTEVGALERISVGSDILKGQAAQVLVPAGLWQGTRLVPGGKWALLGTTMAPGFDFSDFELGNRKRLQELFPLHAETVRAFTRK